MSKIIALQTRYGWWSCAPKTGLIYRLHGSWVPKFKTQRNWLWSGEKRPPSRTCLQHSLNLCNGYAAGIGANLPCKESPFCTQPLQRKGNRVSASQWGRRKGGKEARQRAFVSRSDRNWRGAFKEEEIELIWDEVFFSQHGSVPQSSKKGGK